MADNTDDLIISISTDQATLRRSIKRIEQDLGTLAGTVKKQFDAVGKSVDNSVTTAMQNRINAMVGIGAKGVKEWNGALADQGKELERLRAKYNPLFAVQSQYRKNADDIKRAHALGAISSTEYQAAMSRERQAALAATAAIKGRNQAISAGPGRLTSNGAGAYQTANIAAQFQDIGVTAAMGMNPLQIALQQGTQLSSVFQTMGGGKAVVAGLAEAFASLVNPVSLVTIGLVAGGAAAIQYFSSVSSGGEKSEETLRREEELIQKVIDKWGSALPELRKYEEARQKLADSADIKDAAAIEAARQWEELRSRVSDLTVEFADVVSLLSAAGAEADQVSTLQRAFSDLAAAIKDGSATTEQAKAVQTALAAFASQTGVPAIADFAAQFDGLAASIGKSSTNAAKLKQDAAILVDLVKKLPPLGTLNPMTSAGGRFITDPNEQQSQRARDAESADPKILSNGQWVTPPTPTPRPNIELEGLPGDTKKAGSASNAYRDLVKSADDRLAQMRQEIELTGKAGIEADALRFKLDLLQQAEDKGRKLSAEQRGELEKKVDLYKQYSEQLAKAKLQQDLLEQRKLSGLSSTEQKVYSTLQQYGRPTDLASDEAAAIRQMIQMQDTQDGIKSFLTDFQSALVSSGGDIGEAFATAIKNAINNVLSKVLDQALTNLSKAITGAIFGDGASSSGGGAVAGVVSAVGAAPVIPVQRSGLGNISSYAKAIQSIESGGNYGALGPITKSGDRAYGAYQVMGANIPSWTKGALGQSMSPSAFLSSPSAQDAVFNKYFGASVAKYGNPQDAASVWFTGRPLAQGAGAADILGTTGSQYVDKFNNALGKLGETAEAATSGLGTFGSGLTQVGSALGGAGGGGGGGGGLFSFLGSLFGGGGKTSGSLYTSDRLFRAAGGPVSGPGTGTSDSIPTMLSNGEFVVNARSSRKHMALLHAINNGTIGHMAAGGVVRPVAVPVMPSVARMGNANDNGSRSGVLNVHIHGANGDDHVRNLVKQGVDQGIAAQNEQMRRGGFGTMNNRYSSQKG
ncbi:phage tail length tape measure family protein [Gellertiella hungarica]|uniref:Bacteriophage tail tape measure N-terminal domain-containing protein n=1 Tax=Gellertiella hungarica TaxID=1572859 RepID=A0A7W6JAR9_9HYPH|nr:phage tail length tape measure family protein [Gellertiella hungarica]MBB4067008.1 hypothetical protein [Gellertiella hungarica]